jgi:membrane associated rhomboid family serine protease
MIENVAQNRYPLAMLDDRSYMRTDYRPRWSLTTILLVTLTVCFVLQISIAQYVPDFYGKFALSLDGLREGRVYQLLTFQLLHSNLWHLAGNLMAVYFMGRIVEDFLGRKMMLVLYLLSGVIGGLVQTGLGLILPHLSGPVVGASAGACGLIAAFATRFPFQHISLIIPPVSFPARVLLFIEAAIAIFGILRPMYMPAWAHGAHLGGMLTGIGFIMW